MSESYTLPECPSKPRYEGIFVTSICLIEKATEKVINQISNFEELECEKSLNINK